MDSILAIGAKPNTLPQGFNLGQNYPNPFNPSTTIEYTLPKAQQVRIQLFNLRGQKIKTLYSGKEGAGVHRLSFNAAGLASGVYIYRITAGSFVQQKKMIYLR